MKKLVIALAAFALLSVDAIAQSQYKVVTIVESIVPMGLGRSRLIESKQDMDIKKFTTERTDGKDSDQGDVKRKDAKIDTFSEAKLLNFFAATGINFQNIASNDALIASKINELTAAGWKLTYVTSGVESNAGKGDGEGIFITRLFFSK